MKTAIAPAPSSWTDLIIADVSSGVYVSSATSFKGVWARAAYDADEDDSEDVDMTVLVTIASIHLWPNEKREL